ncbi:MAG: ATP-binding protein [Rhodospirillales bacterium]|nr:ATP-binding protein [Rhodospirillales bacterium]
MGIDGAERRLAPRRLFRALRRFASSLTVKFIVLVAIFFVLPFLVYNQFDKADTNLRSFVTRSIQHKSWLIAQALRPTLDRPDRLPDGELAAQLAKFDGDGTRLQLMLKPAKGAVGHFYYVASSPPVQSDQIDAELSSLEGHGILDRLSRSCSDDTPIDVQYQRPGGQDQILTSLVPIQTRWGCWILVSSHTTSEFLYTAVARPLWTTPESRLAALFYLAGALLAMLVVIGVSRSLRHFRKVAAEIRQGRTRHSSFASQEVAPELSSVAADFDAFAMDLQNVARDIRQAAEDNAHSFKAPVATVEASLETVRRSLPPTDNTAHRAFELIGYSVDRLKALISASQQLDNVTADLIEAPRHRVNLASVVSEVLGRFHDILAEREITILQKLDEKLFVTGSKQVLDVTIENIFDNAISFSPQKSVITVSLDKAAQIADLRIDDQGPGIDPKKIDRIFDRYFSLRPVRLSDEAGDETLPHAGLGLWIVRRNVEALHGTVTATNLDRAGLRIRVMLPISRKWH